MVIIDFVSYDIIGYVFNELISNVWVWLMIVLLWFREVVLLIVGCLFSNRV